MHVSVLTTACKKFSDILTNYSKASNLKNSDKVRPPKKMETNVSVPGMLVPISTVTILLFEDKTKAMLKTDPGTSDYFLINSSHIHLSVSFPSQ